MCIIWSIFITEITVTLLRLMNDIDSSKNTIEELDELNHQIIELIDQIVLKEVEKFDEKYCYHVGSFGKLLRKLLDHYHDDIRTKEQKALLKPQILYFREIQQYLVFFVRFPAALYQKNHPYLIEMRYLIAEKGKLLREKYKEKAIQESMLFESDFRNKLEKTLKKRFLSDGS